MSEKEKSEKTQAQILRDAFEGMKGRQPKSFRNSGNGLPRTKAKRRRCLRQPLFRLGATRRGRNYGAAVEFYEYGAGSRAAVLSHAAIKNVRFGS